MCVCARAVDNPLVGFIFRKIINITMSIYRFLTIWSIVSFHYLLAIKFLRSFIGILGFRLGMCPYIGIIIVVLLKHHQININ